MAATLNSQLNIADMKRKPSRFRAVNGLVLISVCAGLAACTSTQGDLGRPAKNEFAESLMELGGEARAKLSGELYSDFNRTDEEKLMRNKAWILIRPPHAKDWVSPNLWNLFGIRDVTVHVLTETQRTRLTKEVDSAFDPKNYYRALRSERYASHHVRYDRVTSDINQDREALQAFIPVAERVVEMDRQRMAALGRLSDMDPRQMEDAYARVDENRRFIGWVWRALQYRMRAYAYAIKRLEIETPSPKVAEANRALKRLEEDFLRQNGAIDASEDNRANAAERRSRYSRRQWAKDDPNLVK